jgi:regulatory protein
MLSQEEQIILSKMQKWCAQRERSSRDCTQKMQRMGLSASSAFALLEKLQDADFQNDERYTEAFVSGHVKIKRWGPHKITAHLRANGLPTALINAHLNAIPADMHFENLKHLLERKYRDASVLSDVNERQKAMRYAQQRGFSSETIFAVLDELAAEQPD